MATFDVVVEAAQHPIQSRAVAAVVVAAAAGNHPVAVEGVHYRGMPAVVVEVNSRP